MSALTVSEQVDGELVVPLDRLAAEKLDGRIRRLAQAAGEQIVQVGHLLDEAKRGQVHEVLGFASWTAYVADALGGMLELSGESRRAMVALMDSEGMSQRAIAEATGASKTTIHRDLQVVRCGPPEAGGSDGESVAEPATVTGLDGKTHPRHRQPRPSRRGNYTYDLKPIRKAVREVPEQVVQFERLADDEQFCAWLTETSSRVSEVRRAIAKAIAHLQRMDERVQQVAEAQRDGAR